MKQHAQCTQSQKPKKKEVSLLEQEFPLQPRGEQCGGVNLSIFIIFQFKQTHDFILFILIPNAPILTQM